MLNIGPLELIAISMLALLVLGPDKLPGAVRQVGRVFGELRRISTGFQDELRNAFEETEREQERAATTPYEPPELPELPELPDVEIPDPEILGPELPQAGLAASVPEPFEEPGDVAGSPQRAATASQDDEPGEPSDPGAGAEPTEAAEQPEGEPGEDDEGATESTNHQDSPPSVQQAGNPPSLGT